MVPITVMGTSEKMPAGDEFHLAPGEVTIVVHPPISPGSVEPKNDASEAATRQRAAALRDATWLSIASSLPTEEVPPDFGRKPKVPAVKRAAI